MAAKRKVAPLIWQKLGNPDHYIEPFFGSGATLLAREEMGRFETVNDHDGLLCNFWRALKATPEGLAEAAAWPTSELDLIARHNHMVMRRKTIASELAADPEYFDLVLAAWWIWCICSWVGSSYCHREIQMKKPKLCTGNGIFPNLHRGDLLERFRALSDRLKNVRMVCGSWERILTPLIVNVGRDVGILLDPPYDESICGTVDAYGCTSCSRDVREWAIQHGNERRLRIALCGYEGEGHEELEQHGWSVHAWKANCGYANMGKAGRGRENCHKERIWFSPYCL